MKLNRLASLVRQLIFWLRRPSQETVFFTEDHLVLYWPRRGEEALAWDDITRISLRRTEGIAGSDTLFIYVQAGRSRLVIPRSAQNVEALLTFIRGLPACDTAAFDCALAEPSAGPVGAGLVTVWQRPLTAKEAAETF